MELYDDQAAVPKRERVLALGTFDGLHKAHMKIIKSAQAYARQKGMEYGVLIFDKSPRTVIKHQEPEYLITFEEKLELLSDCDFVYIKKFDREFMNLSCEAFLRFLRERIHAKALFAGFNYRFGYHASGDVNTLKQAAEKYGMEVFVTKEQFEDRQTISSSAVRAYIKQGNVEKAGMLLGRDFAIRGTVVKGFQNGRKMGIPTANVDYQKNCLIPQNGVYAGITIVDGQEYPSVINVGANPTFDAQKITVETHILDFDRDIYDKVITVRFQKHIRDDKRFESIEALVEQIHRDIREARESLRHA